MSELIEQADGVLNELAETKKQIRRGIRMRKILSREFLPLILLSVAVIGCAGTPTPADHIPHEGKPGGTIGMGSLFHIEVVSHSSDEYQFYLYDPVGNPLALEAVKVEAALIDSTGKEIARLLVAPSQKGDHLIAKDGPLGLDHPNLRVKVTLRGRVDAETVDMTMEYHADAHPTAVPVAAQTRAATSAPTSATVAQPPATFVPGRFPPVKWSEARSGLTAGASFEPCPFQIGSQTAFSVVLADANGQPVTDAVVELIVTGGTAGMLGEHDEEFSAKLPSQGGGVFRARESFGLPSLVLVGVGIRAKRGEASWSFALPDSVLSSC